MKNQANPSITSSSVMLRAMVGIGIVCGILIVFTYESTSSRIKNLREEALQAAIIKVIPGATKTQSFIYKNGTFTASIQAGENTLYAGYDQKGNFKGLALEASGQGYAGTIKILYGYDPDNQRVIGYYVLESNETPGLGDKIEKDQRFLENFKRLDATLNSDKTGLQNDIVTVKSGAKKHEWEIDGITGATISSRAIGQIINKSTSKWGPLIHRHKKSFE